MGNTLFKICVGGLAGIGLGLIVGKHKIDQLETERDLLETQNICLKSEYEIMQMCNDNLKATNELFTNLLLQEKENEGS